MEVSEAFFNIYARILTEVLFAGQSLLYGYWLKPFVKKRRAAYVPALVYWIINLAGRYILHSRKRDDVILVMNSEKP